MFFVLAGMLDKFVYLKPGVAFILVFVGLKMTLSAWIHIPILPVAGGDRADAGRRGGAVDPARAPREAQTSGLTAAYTAGSAAPSFPAMPPTSLWSRLGPRPPRAPRLGDVRLGELGDADDHHRGRLPDLLREGRRGEPAGGGATQRFATANTLAMVIIALLSPILGTIADSRRHQEADARPSSW